MPNERIYAIEGQTVRLKINNYISNVLTDSTGNVSVVIRPANSSVTLASFFLNSGTVIRESRGVYYVDWAIPSSTTTSPRFDPDFTGTGYYNDIWTVAGSGTFSQDFFIAAEGSDSVVLSTINPFRFSYSLATPRFEIGAKDFLSVLLQETTGQLVNGVDVWPEGEIQLFSGDAVVYNYQPLIHLGTSNEYKYLLDTNPLKSGIFKIQTKHNVPAATIHSKASITGAKSLSQGFTPRVGTAILDMTIDDLNRRIEFPSTATDARLVLNVVNFNFETGNNDIFKINVAGSDRKRRLLSSPDDRTITGVVEELNGIWPTTEPSMQNSIWPVIDAATVMQFPVISNALDFDATIADDLQGKTLTFIVDNSTYSVQFPTQITPLVETDIIDSINGVDISFSTDPIAHLFSGTEKRIFLGRRFGDASINSIKIVEGSALPIMGFIENQDDSSKYGLKLSLADTTIAITDNGGQIQLESSSTIRIMTPAEGSTANDDLGFAAGGETDSPIPATPATIVGSPLTSPISVQNPTKAALTSSEDVTLNLETLAPHTPVIDGKTLIIERNGVAYPTITFAATLLPPAITSGFNSGTYELTSGTNDILKVEWISDTQSESVSVDLLSTGTSVLTSSAIVTTLNAAFLAATSPSSPDVVADVSNGRIRIRGKTGKFTSYSGKYIRIDKSVVDSANATLGFDEIGDPSPSDPVIFQNDQLTETVTLITANPYKSAITLSNIVTQINAVTNTPALVTANLNTVASLNKNKLILTHNLVGGLPNSLEVDSASTSAGQLALSTQTPSIINGGIGLDGQNYDFKLKLSPSGPEQVVVFENGIRAVDYFVNKINAGITGASASKNSGNGITITHGVAGSIGYLNINTSTYPIPSEMGFTIPTTSTNGTDAVNAVILAADTFPLTLTPSATPNFFSRGFSALKMRDEPTIDYKTIFLTVPADINTVQADIQAVMTGLSVSVVDASTLLIANPDLGSTSFLQIGSFNDGSESNVILGISVDGITTTGADGIPYDIEDIVVRINAAFGGNETSINSANFLTLQSINEGASAYITVGNNTTSDIITDWGISKGTYVGETRTQAAQVIVSPKLTLSIGS